MRTDMEKAVELLHTQNPQALERALELMYGTVFSFSMSVCGHREDAEDTAQEVVLKAIPYLPRFENLKALRVWLYKVAKNQCLMHRRRSKFAPKENLSLEELMPDRQELKSLSGEPDTTPEISLLRRESERGVRAAVQKLPADYRLILVLHDLEELSSADVAEITGLQVGTIRVRLHRARLFVRKELARQDRNGTLRGKPVGTAEVNLPIQTGKRRCRALFAELSNFIDNELDDSLCEELEKHMAGCEPCKAFVTSLEKAIQSCRQAPSELPDPHMPARLRRELISQYQGLMRKIHERDGHQVKEV